MQQRWGLPIVAWPSRLRPSYWDGIALPLVLGAIVLIAWASRQMSVPYHPGEALPISLDPRELPQYGLRTVLRMVAALIASLVFSLGYAAIAAKSKRAEKLLIPILDILQSVPILGFLSITVTGFIALFPGSLLGYECAAIFAIFTSQAWNMTFSLYQSFIAVPSDLREASYALGTTKFVTITRIVLPTAISGLITGVMIAIARVIGETAPIFIAASFTNNFNVNPFANAMSTLPVVAYTGYKFPSTDIQGSYASAWGAALLLVILVVILNLIARIIARIFAGGLRCTVNFSPALGAVSTSPR